MHIQLQGQAQMHAALLAIRGPDIKYQSLTLGAQTLHTADMLELCDSSGTSTSGLSMCALMNRQRGADGRCGVEEKFIYVTKGAQEKRSRALELCQICCGGNA